MVFTGVTRRIDDLGRIVIPKEIRNSLSIRSGDNLKIYIENDKLVISKITNNPNYNDYVIKICNQIVNSFNVDIIVTDRDKIVFCNNLKYSNFNFKIEHEKVLVDRKEYVFEINDDKFYLKPIILNSNIIGIICIKVDNNQEEIKKIINYLNNIIINRLDIS